MTIYDQSHREYCDSKLVLVVLASLELVYRIKIISIQFI